MRPALFPTSRCTNFQGISVPPSAASEQEPTTPFRSKSVYCSPLRKSLGATASLRRGGCCVLLRGLVGFRANNIDVVDLNV